MAEVERMTTGRLRVSESVASSWTALGLDSPLEWTRDKGGGGGALDEWLLAVEGRAGWAYEVERARWRISESEGL
jgi:hypothetical protein